MKPPVSVGVLGSRALPGFAVAPAIVAGIAAGAAASMRLPFFGALLVGLTAAGTAPIAVIAAITGWLVVLRLDPPPAAPAAPAPTRGGAG